MFKNFSEKLLIGALFFLVVMTAIFVFLTIFAVKIIAYILGAFVIIYVAGSLLFRLGFRVYNKED